MNHSDERAQQLTEATEVIQHTKNVKSVRFIRPKDFNYLPGQWASITLNHKNEQKTKPLSFSSSPTEEYLEVTKRLTGHDFSNAFDTLMLGDMIAIRGPFGNFTFMGAENKVCMLSGGIGITPLRSMIRYSLDRGLKTNIILLYSNRFEDEIAFKNEFDQIQKMNPKFKMIITVTRPSQNWIGFSGRINMEMIKNTVPEYMNRVFYTSGPRPMVDEMVDMLSKIGLSSHQIKYEYFSGYLGAPGNKPAP